MNSTLILFLNMLKSDIKKYSNLSGDMLAGQTIKRSEIEMLPSMKLMNSDEVVVVNSILNEMSRSGYAEGKNKQLIKQIDGLVPYMVESSDQISEFRDAA